MMAISRGRKRTTSGACGRRRWCQRAGDTTVSLPRCRDRSPSGCRRAGHRRADPAGTRSSAVRDRGRRNTGRGGSAAPHDRSPRAAPAAAPRSHRQRQESERRQGASPAPRHGWTLHRPASRRGSPGVNGAAGRNGVEYTPEARHLLSPNAHFGGLYMTKKNSIPNMRQPDAACSGRPPGFASA